MSSGPTQTPARPARWKTILLIVSLGINLVVAAAVVTHLASDRGWRHEHGQHKSISRLFPRAFFDDLPQDRREQLMAMARDTARQQRGEMGQRGEFFKLIGVLADRLEQTPYDPAAVDAVLEEMGKKGAQLMAVHAAVTEKLVSALDEQERRSLARHMRERLERWKKRRDRDDDDDRD